MPRRDGTGPQGGGMGKGMGMGSGGSCVCPKCGYTAPHQRGVPCTSQQCPKCGIAMTRKN